jgi:hypothetical protein
VRNVSMLGPAVLLALVAPGGIEAIRAQNAPSKVQKEVAAADDGPDTFDAIGALENWAEQGRPSAHGKHRRKERT